MSNVKIYWTLTQSPGAHAALWVLLVALCVSTITDLRQRKIFNFATFPAALLGFVIHGWMGGGLMLLSSFLGFAIWLAVGIAAWSAFRGEGLGAGDVKMVAAMGALIGFWPAFWAYFISNLTMVAYLPLRWLVQGTLTENLRLMLTWLHSLLSPGSKVVHFKPVGMEDRTPHAPLMLFGVIAMLTLSHFGVLPW
jgi:Flp pilus assembly protein protease CpaA